MSAAAAKRTVLATVSLFAFVTLAFLVPAGGASDSDSQSPTTPVNLRVTSATSSLVTVVWDPSTDDVGVVGYEVRRTNQPTVTVDKPEYAVTGLQCGQSTRIRVVAFDQAQNRSGKATITVAGAACLDMQPPVAPGGFTQIAATTDAVVLAWSPSSDDVGVVGYGVYRNLQRVATTAEPNVTLSGLTCGSTYSYLVDAADAAGNRSLQTTVYVRTAGCVRAPSDTTPPSMPTGLVPTSVTPTALALRWNAATDNIAVTGYDVYRDGTKVASPTTTSASQSGLACGNSYLFKVAAHDAAGNTSPRAKRSVSTNACPSSADSTPPSSPTGLAASGVTQTGFVLNWTASSDDGGVAGYDVYRDGNKVASPTATSVIQNGLACGKSYVLEVSARDVAGNASPRALLTISTGACTTPPADTAPPSTPSGLGVSGATRTSVLLGWNASIDNSGVAGYRVYINGTYTTTATQLSATMLRLSCGTAYTFGVDAVDAAGNASVPASVTGSTTACPDIAAPTAPTNLVTTSRTATSVALNWSASNDDVGVTGYGLYRGGSSTGTSSTTTGIFSGLACGTNYTLAVDANDAAGNRSAQTVVMVSTTACPDTTAPSAPTALSASSVTQTSLVLNWIGSSDNVSVSSYDVYEDGAKVASVSSTSSAQSGLACGTSYTFGVVARDAAGNSSATTSLNASTGACPAPTWTSSIADGAAVPAGVTWTATVTPTPDSVEFWEGPVGGASTKLKTDTSAPYDVVLNLASGSYVLGVCSVQGTVRTCYDDRKNVTISATSSAPPPPPSGSSPYFDVDYSNGRFDAPWTLLFNHTSPGWTNLPATQSPDGRVAVVTDPAGGSGKAARFELRDSDPGWPTSPDVQKAEVRTDTEETFNKSAVSVGDVRWFSTRIYLPYNANEKFEWAHGGSQPYTSLFGLHTGSSTGWSAILMGWEAWQLNAGDKNMWMNFNVEGGTFPETTYQEIVNLFQVTDSSGNRVMANANRWINLVWGMRFAPDNTGWLEAWVDGVNVYPRKNRPTMWAGDTGQYFKYGLYKRKDASFPEGGRSVVYFGRTTIGLTKP